LRARWIFLGQVDKVEAMDKVDWVTSGARGSPGLRFMKFLFWCRLAALCSSLSLGLPERWNGATSFPYLPIKNTVKFH